jgi:hypothetical protein
MQQQDAEKTAAAVAVREAVVLVAEAVAAVVAVVANYDTVNLSNSTGLASDRLPAGNAKRERTERAMVHTMTDCATDPQRPTA